MSKALTGSKFLNNPDSSEIYYTGSGTGAVATTVQSKLREFVSVKDFGAVAAAGYMNGNFGQLPDAPRPDNTSAFQAAIDHCIATGKTLYIPAGCYYFENSVGLTINGSLDIVGEGWTKTQLAVNFTLRASPKTANFLTVTNNRGRMYGFMIRSGSYLGRGIHLNASVGDNQKLTIEKVWIDTCRYGLHVDSPECVNQMEVNGCVFQSNYFWGIYINSFTPPASYGHSAPIHFHNTISNGNGPTTFAMASTYTAGPGSAVAVKDANTDIGGQLWMRGFSNVQFIGGQLSGHGSPRTQGLAVLVNGNSFKFYGTDIEDIAEGTAYTSDGLTAITSANLDTIESTYANDASGGALVVVSVLDFGIDGCHLFSLGTLASVKLVFGVSKNASIGNITPSQALRYDVWDTNTDKDNPSHHYIHPSLLALGNGINSVAFENLAYRPNNVVLLHHELGPAQGVAPNTGTVVPHTTRMWQNGTMQDPLDLNKGWNLTYLSNHNAALSGSHLYNEVSVNQLGASVITQPNELKYLYISTVYGSYGDGRFVVQALDGSGSILSSAWWAPYDFSSQFPMGGTVRFTVPAGTKKIRYGFVNSVNYSGALRDHFMASFAYSTRFFLRVSGVMTDIGRYGFLEPPYTAAKDDYRVGFVRASAQVDSVATTVAGVVSDFNALLAKLRAAQIINP